MHSADCRKMSVRLYARPSVCPPVCHTPVFCQHRLIYPHFLPPDSRTILGFFVPNIIAIFRLGPPKGASNAKGYEKCDFRPISCFILEIIEDTAIVTMEGEYETVSKLSNGTSFSDPEWPVTWISRSRYYSTSNNSKMVQDRAIVTTAEQ